MTQGGGQFKSRGFGLIEVLLSGALAAILLATALPAWHDMLSRQRLKQLAQEVKDDLMLARSESRRLNSVVRVGFSSNELGTCYVLYRGPQGDC
ncbi:MAG: prepilin-type N-terminal cleavage/methylation domain-containing protein [Pelomonas sp.]|nr:prepilin-type N-terminal cleavage/methylation domain-containing protein [Roseateles sp.]MBV8469962.1 prepilin-type N-terminal cleavage/methylation domain-containing protein [Burkholderiaceae bacterium]MBV8604612.1 prepilin-type N-terminal cleavage/methylation domain-containing protein [Roseateles sp.]